MRTWRCLFAKPAVDVPEPPLASAFVLRTLLVLLVLFGTGAPLALCLARSRFEWTRLVFEALVTGLLAQIAIAFVLLRTDRTRLRAFPRSGSRFCSAS